MNTTIPQIVTTNDLNKRAYITFYYKGVRVREYNGNALNLRLFPNHAKTIIERNKILETLQYEYRKALETNDYPRSKVTGQSRQELLKKKKIIERTALPKLITVKEALTKALDQKLITDLSKTYKRDLTSALNKFLNFLGEEEKVKPLTAIPTSTIQEFLSQFGSSGTYYMNVRRNLSVLFNAAASIQDLQVKTVKTTSKRKVKARLHQKYEDHQLKPILAYLKDNYYNLYICCLLTYSAWLRPHEEIRLLTPIDFKKGLTEIHLTGEANKGGKVRVVYLPDYVRNDVSKLLIGLQEHDNIFSRGDQPFNVSYFNTQWSRAYKTLCKLKLIKRNQTIYSFRHTAAVKTYNKTKDVYLLQKLLGHSSILVTLRYLRSLGELNSDDMKNAAPTLE